MLYLIIVSLIWAFSFGLIGSQLRGLDPILVSSIRLTISLLVFLPFFRRKGLDRRTVLQLLGIGAVQYGVMYIAYISSYRYLQSHQIALFTIFTPIFVTLIHDALRGEFSLPTLVVALIAVQGAAIIKYSGGLDRDALTGFLLMQLSNAAFAWGQVMYRRLFADRTVKEHQVYALLYAGAVAVCVVAGSFLIDWDKAQLTSHQWLVLVYLGAVASGLCFFLWNYGCRRTDAGAMAVANNLKIPLAISVSLLVFKEATDLLRLLLGGSLMLEALLLNHWLRKAKREG